MNTITTSTGTSRRRGRHPMPAYFLGRPVDVYATRYGRRRPST